MGGRQKVFKLDSMRREPDKVRHRRKEAGAIRLAHFDTTWAWTRAQLSTLGFLRTGNIRSRNKWMKLFLTRLSD